MERTVLEIDAPLFQIQEESGGRPGNSGILTTAAAAAEASAHDSCFTRYSIT